MKPRFALYAGLVFAAVCIGALLIGDPAEGNGDQCATVRNGTPTTCPEPFPPMTSEPTTTTTSEPAAPTSSTTLAPRPPVVDPTPDPEDRTEIDTAIVVDAEPAAPVQSEATYTG